MPEQRPPKSLHRLLGCALLLGLLACVALVILTSSDGWIVLAVALAVVWVLSPLGILDVLVAPFAIMQDDFREAERSPLAPLPPSAVADPPYPQLEALVGREGIAATPLKPNGFVTIAGRQESALSDDGYLERDTPVVVVGTRASNLIVRRKAA